MPIPRSAMRAKGMQLAFIALVCSMASAQPPAGASVERTLYFANAGTAQTYQELGNAIRTVTGVEQAAVDDAQKSMTVRGAAAQVDLAEWLLRELDKPAGQSGAQNSGRHEYHAPGDGDFVTRVFYPAQIRTAQNLQELVNLIRTVVDIQRIFPDNAQQAVALRGTTAQLALVEWLVNALDIPPAGMAATQRRPSATYPYPAPPRVLPSGALNPDPAWRLGDTVARVFYLADTDTPQGIQEMVNALRTTADIQRMFPYSGARAIVSRGTAAQDALAEWLLNELDHPPAGAQPATTQGQNPVTREYQMSGDSSDIVQVLHFRNATAQQLQETANAIRTKLNVTRLFPCSAKSALALRGTASQVALAGQLIQERNTPAAR